MRPTKERLEEIRDRPIDNSTVFYERAIMELLAEIDALRADLLCKGIHTCHDQCNNPMCLLRKERDQLRENLAAVIHVVQDHAEAGNIDHYPYLSEKLQEVLRE